MEHGIEEEDISMSVKRLDLENNDDEFKAIIEETKKKINEFSEGIKAEAEARMKDAKEKEAEKPEEAGGEEILNMPFWAKTE